MGALWALKVRALFIGRYTGRLSRKYNCSWKDVEGPVLFHLSHSIFPSIILSTRGTVTGAADTREIILCLLPAGRPQSGGGDTWIMVCFNTLREVLKYKHKGLEEPKEWSSNIGSKLRDHRKGPYYVSKKLTQR